MLKKLFVLSAVLGVSMAFVPMVSVAKAITQSAFQPSVKFVDDTMTNDAASSSDDDNTMSPDDNSNDDDLSPDATE